MSSSSRMIETLIADRVAARFHHWIIENSETLATDLDGPTDSDLFASLSIFDWRCRPLHIDRHTTRSRINRQIAGNCKLSWSRRFDALRFELHHRVMRDIEKLGTLQIGIPFRLAGVDRGAVDGGFHG